MEGGISIRIGADVFDLSREQTDRLLDDIMNAKGEECEHCSGRGVIGDWDCTPCQGRGWTA